MWPGSVELLRPAIEMTQGTHEDRDVLSGIIRGDLQLWIGTTSALVTEVVTYPRLKALRFFLAGGDLEEVRHMEQEIARGAKDLGFNRLEFGGRAGWVRALKDQGYVEMGRYCMKEI